MKRTFGSIMQENHGVGPGFDFMRLTLALAVVLFHSFQLSYGRHWSAGPFQPAIVLIVPAFFALSGFLVMGSLIRINDVRHFLLFRALRIIPALAGVVTVSAFVLGPMVTSVSLPEYFADPIFAHYFTNLIGVIHYALPGVFLGNPLPAVVNGQLWTVPCELHCYIGLAIALLLRIATRPKLMLGLFLLLSAAECLTVFTPGHHYTARVLNSEEMLDLSFLCGGVVYLWKDKIPPNLLLFAGSILTYAAIALWVPALGFILGTAAATYFVVYLGMQRIPRIPILMAGDLSYGIYLYSFPIQQAMTWAFPDHQQWYFNLVVSVPPTILLAAASWHWLEKPALSLRRYLTPRALLLNAPTTPASPTPFGTTAIADP